MADGSNHASPIAHPPPLLSSVAWGVFCTCSWTWCIGMYLPVILLREFGWPGFLAFAVPNVVGCGAFGYVLKDRQRRESLLHRHEGAARWFSLVAVAFNAFFAAFLLSAVLGLQAAAGVGAALIVVALGLALSLLPAGAWPVLSFAVYAISMTVLLRLGPSDLGGIPWHGTRDGSDLLWLVPVFLLGFLLCPYLDLTFHRALKSSPSRHAFAVFAATFAVMLVLTCAYSTRLALTALLMAHIGAQLLFTISAHLREVRLMGRRWILPAAIIAVAGVLLAPVAGGARAEQAYLRFLAFYGLVFPAYVLIFMGPGRPLPLSRRNVLAYAVVVLLGLPFFELAFFHDHMWMVGVPLAGVVAVRIAGAIVSSHASRSSPRGMG